MKMRLSCERKHPLQWQRLEGDRPCRRFLFQAEVAVLGVDEAGVVVAAAAVDAEGAQPFQPRATGCGVAGTKIDILVAVSISQARLAPFAVDAHFAHEGRRGTGAVDAVVPVHQSGLAEADAVEDGSRLQRR